MKRLALLTIVSCAPPDDLTLEWRFIDQRADGMAEACALADLDCSEVIYSWGALTMRPAKDGQRSCGRTEADSQCRPEAFGCDVCGGHVLEPELRGICMLHELGHVAGLEHVDDPENVMFPRSGRENTVLEADQMDAIHERAYELQLCQGNP